MIKFKMYIIMFCLIFSSCGGGYEVTTINDANRGFTIHRMKGNFLPDPDFTKPYGNIQIDADFYNGNGTKTNYSGLVVICLAPQGVRIQEDSSLTVIIDGTSTVLSSNKSDYQVEEIEMARTKYLHERAWFRVDTELICSLGSATSVQYSLKGEQKVFVGTLSKENIERFKTFCSEFIK